MTIYVPDCSILGSILFLLYINDFPNISDEMSSVLHAETFHISASVTRVGFEIINKCTTLLLLCDK